MNRISKLAVTAAATTLAGPLFLTAPAFADTPPPAATTGCKVGALPVTVLGAPGVKAQNALGVYLWNNGHGYALRATHPGKAKIVVSGTITVSRTVHNVKRIRLEPHDTVTVSPNRTTLNFRFTNYGYLDGVDFAADCSRTVKVVVRLGTVQATPAQVFLGKNRLHPTSVPFTIERANGAVAARVV